MTKKALWTVATLLVIVALILAACAQAPTVTAPAAVQTAAPTTTAAPKTTAAAETLRYGGVLIQRLTMDPTGFDDQLGAHQSGIPTGLYTNEELLQGDWAKGPFGTGENDWSYGFIGRVELETGRLAESWEFPSPGTVIWHIRKGIHWQNKAPVNGREYTADDAVFNLTRWLNSKASWLYLNYVPQGYAPTSVKALDKWTVEAKIPAILFGQMFITMSDFGIFHYPPEAVAKYGDMKDWQNAVGTGPFMLTDYVSGSSITFARNPDYWMKDPLHPQNQLPYVDGLKLLIIPDTSTALSALRTGKLDVMEAVGWDDTVSLKKTSPDLQYKQVVTAPFLPVGRLDKPELPFRDIRVRQALNMAVNKQELIDKYYDGHAYMLGYPFPPSKSYDKIYTPLEQQSAAVQDLFKYNPDKAKKLLAEAGYPNGFKTTIDCVAVDVDLLSVVKADLIKIGVDMDIHQMENGVFNTLSRSRAHKEMIMKGSVDYAFPWRLMMVRGESMDNPSIIDDSTFRAAYETMGKLVGVDDAKVSATLKEISKYSLEQAWGIWMPAYDTTRVWWPWVKNYGGVANGGYDNRNDWTKYASIDLTLKKSMGH